MDGHNDYGLVDIVRCEGWVVSLMSFVALIAVVIALSLVNRFQVRFFDARPELADLGRTIAAFQAMLLIGIAACIVAIVTPFIAVYGLGTVAIYHLLVKPLVDLFRVIRR